MTNFVLICIDKPNALALRMATREAHFAYANATPGVVRLGGPLGRVFGVCANEYAPDDGRVVSLDHGCGAHSEAPAGAQGAATPVIDELGYDLVDAPGVSLDETVFESLDHA